MNSRALSRSFFTHVQIPALAVVLSFILACMAMPTPTRAAGLTETQVKAVVSLLESFNADQATLLRVTRALGATTTSPMLESRGKSPEHASLCGLLHRELKRGSSGDDVKALQTFLAQDKDVYAEGEVTGFFGERTEAAIKRFQAKLGIVSSGDSVSTGYGRVGAKTRAALLERCANTKDNMNMLKMRPPEDRIGTSSRREHKEWGDTREEDASTTSYRSVLESNLLASAAASMSAPFEAITDILSDTFFALGLY